MTTPFRNFEIWFGAVRFCMADRFAALNREAFVRLLLPDGISGGVKVTLFELLGLWVSFNSARDCFKSESDEFDAVEVDGRSKNRKLRGGKYSYYAKSPSAGRPFIILFLTGGKYGFAKPSLSVLLPPSLSSNKSSGTLSISSFIRLSYFPVIADFPQSLITWNEP